MNAATAAMAPKRKRNDGVIPGKPVTPDDLKKVSYETETFGIVANAAESGRHARS